MIDKDRAAGLLAEELDADAPLMLTDVDAVYRDWGAPSQAAIRHGQPQDLDASAFTPGLMAPKVGAACAFASGPGRVSGIGRLEDARADSEGARRHPDRQCPLTPAAGRPSHPVLLRGRQS